jgi:para-aminobenzoate synthetase component I
MQESLNYIGRHKIPSLFIISYDTKEAHIVPLDALDEDILFNIDGFANDTHVQPIAHHVLDWKMQSVPFSLYESKFNLLIEELRAGNCYLANLTQPTKVQSNASLFELYAKASAPFKLYYKEQFTLFSPERFVKISGNTIETFPMKGTIDASIPNAKEMILANKKELAEHTMVVDLLRNDLSQVAKNVKVEKFRYVERLNTDRSIILQVSSHISGVLESDWREHLGDMFAKLLPAGSITGTPKKSTIEILEKIEDYKRGFFSGVFGYFDGENLDSAVMIRFIEKDENGELTYKSGGGITCDSDAKSEYEEMKQKVYLAVS